MLKAKQILKTYHFLIILLQFTIVYALKVIYICRICVVETLYHGGCYVSLLNSTVSDTSLVAWTQRWWKLYTREVGKRY